MLQNFVRQFLLLSEIAANVVKTFLENKYQPDDFKTFLENNKILLYHLHDNHRSGCCTCINLPRQQVIRKVQFDKLFVTNGQHCQKLAQKCHCKFIANPGIQLVDVDLTLLICLLNNCYILNPQQEQCVTDIRTVRNEIAHFAHDNDIDNITFNIMWGKVTNATIHLAMCISPSYSTEIQDKIRQLKERTISPVEYTDALLEICQWKLNHDESTSKIFHLLQVMQLQNVTRDEEIKRMEIRILDAISNQRSTENQYNSIRLAPDETEVKTGDQSGDVSCLRGLDEDDVKYFKLFGEVQELWKNGSKDENGGILYSVLVYFVLHGSSTEDDIDYEILTKIYESIYKRSVSIETASIKTCLAELVPKYLDQIDEKFTPCSINVVKSVIYSFGNECCECFVQYCSPDILLDNVIPSGTSTDNFHVSVDASVLVPVLVQRMLSTSVAKSIGKYVCILTHIHENVETANLFIDELEQSDESFTSDHMICLLDGLTKMGKEFEIFEKLEKLFNVFCRQVDEFGNTLFHYLVARFPESKRFNSYIKFFCESNIVVMQLENDEKYTAIDFASYQGRYDVIADVLCNIDNTEDIIARILNMVKDGVDSLQHMNSESEVACKLHLSAETDISLGDSQDYENILDIIGRREIVVFNGGNTQDEDDEKRPSKRKEETSSKSADDMSKSIGEGIIDLVKEINKSLNVITKFPNLVQTIHQAIQNEDKH
ncbi:uncharacterized protein LOC127712506 [Mytilus californianus]|uniref:uncharacterized protein LOC127712506 n=1 Tax=Mytilus californianus TaxID=6549 RepID=UPI0022467C65|nr:uncharacterized protein LOC127712506 [Mytilus californianus]